MVGFHELGRKGDGERKETYKGLWMLGWKKMRGTWDTELLMVLGVSTYTEIKDITKLVLIT